MLDQQVYDKGNGQQEAQAMLQTLGDQGFDGDNDKFAIAETIDDDVVMKVRGIAIHRGIELE